MPLQRLDVGTSGLVTFVRKPELVAAVGARPRRRPTRPQDLRRRRPRRRPQQGRHHARAARGRQAPARPHALPPPRRSRRATACFASSPSRDALHQIRRHLAAIGHPVIGDDRYGHALTNRYFEEKNGLDRTFLHCVRLEIDHPDTGAHLIVEAPLPGDLRAVLERTSGPATLRFLDHKNALGTSGTSHLPPGADEVVHDRGSVLDVDGSSPSLKPELTGDDDGDQRDSGF